MCKPFAGIAIVAAAVSLTGCGGSSTTASRDCFEVWNDASNKAGQLSVAGRFSVASVSEWHAEPTGSGTANLGGPESQGCAYLFHSSKRYLSISGEWRRDTIQWGLPPSINGSWSQEHVKAARKRTPVAPVEFGPSGERPPAGGWWPARC
jgi:hypothetical protein